tara:strand:+ start:115 stop:759 length:645 start_codon:yes stop_codon:yes gene_type:complete
MISHDPKYVFVHVSKTGGTSVEKALGGDIIKFDGTGNSVNMQSPVCGTTGNPTGKHWSLKDYFYRIFKQDVDIFSNYFTFAFVRNPWDRIVSNWRWRQKVMGKRFRKTYPDFNTYVNESVDPRNKVGSMIEFSYRSPGGHDQNITVDFVGKYESLQKDFNTICRKIGMKPQQLPHHNNTIKTKHYTEYYNKQTRDLVAKIHAYDIEKYNYTFKK